MYTWAEHHFQRYHNDSKGNGKNLHYGEFPVRRPTVTTRCLHRLQESKITGFTRLQDSAVVYTHREYLIFFLCTCKIEFYFTEWTPNVAFSHTSFGVHEWNKIQSYAEKKKKIEFSVSFMLLFCIKIHCSEVWFTPNYGVCVCVCVCGVGGGWGGGRGKGLVSLTSPGHPTDIGLQLSKACYPCSR